MVIRKMESQALAWFHTAGASTNLRHLPWYASQGAVSRLNCTLQLCCAECPAAEDCHLTK